MPDRLGKTRIGAFFHRHAVSRCKKQYVAADFGKMQP
jgi:hypothetical protein